MAQRTDSRAGVLHRRKEKKTHQELAHNHWLYPLRIAWGEGFALSLRPLSHQRGVAPLETLLLLSVSLISIANAKEMRLTLERGFQKNTL